MAEGPGWETLLGGVAASVILALHFTPVRDSRGRAGGRIRGCRRKHQRQNRFRDPREFLRGVVFRRHWDKAGVPRRGLRLRGNDEVGRCGGAGLAALHGTASSAAQTRRRREYGSAGKSQRGANDLRSLYTGRRTSSPNPGPSCRGAAQDTHVPGVAKKKRTRAARTWGHVSSDAHLRHHFDRVPEALGRDLTKAQGMRNVRAGAPGTPWATGALRAVGAALMCPHGFIPRPLS